MQLLIITIYSQREYRTVVRSWESTIKGSLLNAALPLKSCLNSGMSCNFAKSQFLHSEMGVIIVPTSPQWVTLRVKLGNTRVPDA